MFGKTNNNKFTIQFNPKIPEEKKAIEILGALGRKKASYIAEAICAYSGGNLTQSKPVPASNSEATVHQKVKPISLGDSLVKENDPAEEKQSIHQDFIREEADPAPKENEYSEILAAINGFDEMEN